LGLFIIRRVKIGKKKESNDILNSLMEYMVDKPDDLLTIDDGLMIWALHHVADKSGSEKTVSAYRGDLRKLKEYMISCNIEPLLCNVTVDLIRKFKIHFETNYDPAPQSKGRMVFSLKSVFSYLSGDDCRKIQSDPTRQLTMPRAKRMTQKESRIISRKDRKELQKRALNKGLKEFLIFELLTACGPRPEQIRLLQWPQIDPGNNIIFFPVLKRGSVPKPKITGDLMKKLMEYKKEGGGIKYVFRSREGEPMSGSQMKKIVGDVLKAPDLGICYNSRDARATVATEIGNTDGCNPKTVQIYLGHAKIESQMPYLKAEEKGLDKAAHILYYLDDVDTGIHHDPACPNEKKAGIPASDSAEDGFHKDMIKLYEMHKEGFISFNEFQQLKNDLIHLRP